MGGSESKAVNGSGNKAEGGDEYHTPIANRRVQKLVDPRSPTDDVQRTPIQRPVDGNNDSFEDPRSPTSYIARTPVPDDSDPRSPSGGREAGPFIFPTVPEDPRSPTHSILRTPLTKDAPINSLTETVTVHQADNVEPTGDSNNDNVNEESANEESANQTPAGDTETGVFQIETDKTNLLSEGSEEDATDSGDNVPNETSPDYEMELSKMVEKQTIANEESENKDCATVVLSDREMVFLTELPPSPVSTGPSSHHQRAKGKKKKHQGIRRSLKETFSSSLAVPRSPLATRNLLQDSPDPTHRTATPPPLYSKAGGVAVFQKHAGTTRLHHGDKRQHPIQTVGRYQPVLDKENY